MENEFLSSKISNIFGKRPTESSGETLESLANRGVNAFVTICWKPGSFYNFFPKENKKQPYFHEFITENDNGNLTNSWKEIIKEKTCQTHIILLPKMKTEASTTLFNDVRDDLYGTNKSVDKHIIFLGEYSTWEQMIIENNTYSELGKELIPEIWLFESIGGQHQVNAWLTGGDCQAIKYFRRHLSSHDIDLSDLGYEIRRIAHNLVTEMMQKGNSESLDQRLRILLDAKDDNIISQYFSAMYTLLPGTYDPSSRLARQAWFDRRYLARWRPFTALHAEKQALLMGGLIRYEPGEKQTQFRLRNPLLAYVVARHGLGAQRWVAHAPKVKEALQKRHTETIEKDSDLTSLDYYIDALLDKASGIEDGQDDHWMAAKQEKNLLIEAKKGQWWKRLTFDTALN